MTLLILLHTFLNKHHVRLMEIQVFWFLLGYSIKVLMLNVIIIARMVWVHQKILQLQRHLNHSLTLLLSSALTKIFWLIILLLKDHIRLLMENVLEMLIMIGRLKSPVFQIFYRFLY